MYCRRPPLNIRQSKSPPDTIPDHTSSETSFSQNRMQFEIRLKRGSIKLFPALLEWCLCKNIDGSVAEKDNLEDAIFWIKMTVSRFVILHHENVKKKKWSKNDLAITDFLHKKV